MKENSLSMLAEQYLAALRTHFDQDPQASLQAAHDLGDQVVALGLETLDLAKIHDLALASLILPDCSTNTREDMTTRAEMFFTEAITPIEETHHAALKSSADLNELNETLDQRTQDLAESKHELQKQITERLTAEADLQTSERASSQLLKDSRLLEQHLQEMARKILSANEAERKKMSLQLNDDIAQTLLGINMRLLTLKKEVASNHADITQEILITTRLVEQSVQIIKRLALEFGTPNER